VKTCLPLAFEIDASSLAAAVEKFAPAAELAVERTVIFRPLRRQVLQADTAPTGESFPGLRHPP